MNFFAPRTAAGRYAKGRPFFHPTVVELIGEFLSLDGPFEAALDVGCGTGLSSVALAEIASGVIGIDVSAEMLALATKHPRVEYLLASAERLPFGPQSFQLITASSAFHWLDQTKFLAEARRVLIPGGNLVVYDNYFTGSTAEASDFHNWFRDFYLKEYPSPPRREVVFSPEGAEAEGFRLLGHERYENSVLFSPEGLIQYLATQSNIIAAVEGGREGIEDVRRRLAESLETVFDGREELTFHFGGPIWFLQKDE